MMGIAAAETGESHLESPESYTQKQILQFQTTILELYCQTRGLQQNPRWNPIPSACSRESYHFCTNLYKHVQIIKFVQIVVPRKIPFFTGSPSSNSKQGDTAISSRSIMQPPTRRRQIPAGIEIQNPRILEYLSQNPTVESQNRMNGMKSTRNPFFFFFYKNQ